LTAGSSDDAALVLPQTQDMNDLPSWVMNDPHAVMQLLLEGEISDEETAS
jgi:hypothetical protein